MKNSELKLDMKLVRNPFVKNPVFVTGLTRAGKSMLSPIIASLERAELVQVNHLMEQFPMLHNSGFISDDVAIYLLRFAVDFMLTDTFIGRNVNFRYADMTGVWTAAKDPGVYFKRLFADEGNVVLKEIEKADPVLVLNVHYGMWHVDIFRKAFPEMKMIHMKRHPVDIVYSWYKKGYGDEFAENPRNGALTVQGKNKIIPYFGIGWQDEYEQLSGVNRIIHTIHRIEDVHTKKINSLSDKDSQQVRVISFENMVTNPKKVLSEICAFLGMKETLYTPIVLKRERCPRVISEAERNKKVNAIRQLACDAAFNLLMSMVKEYEVKGDK